MILIADSGGTKADWCLLDGEKEVVRFTTIGMHALMLTEEELRGRISEEVARRLEQFIDRVDKVYFYGAGCVSEQVCSSVRNAIKSQFPKAQIEVTTDLLGASRALCGKDPGIVCLLGTGSNSCYYDGHRIVENVSPLGYILGDEGSGAYLGKILVGDVLKRQLPPDLCEKFLSGYNLNVEKIVHRVYREPNPNAFLGSLTTFLSENIDNKAIRSLVLNGFKAFFQRNVCLYRHHNNLKVNCCGSIGYHFSEIFHEAAACYGFTVGTMIRTPMDGLVEYHMANG